MNKFLIPPSTKALQYFYQELLSWFDENGRHDLPWKPKEHNSEHQNIYHVWLSEIMLQQTQVVTVIPYFLKFIEAFPTINDLANANLEEVLKLWEGLGYYSRAKNLHHGAQFIAQELNGIIPENYQSILQIKGVGRTTASAIMSQGFNRPFAILDGNVKRVLARVLGAEYEEKKLEKTLLPFAYIFAQQARPKDYTQAIMDFGATICARSPKCQNCFWQKKCITLFHQKIADIPAKKIKIIKKDIELYPVIIMNQNDQLIFRQRIEEKIWHNLYEFPHLLSNLQDINHYFKGKIRIISTTELSSFKHVLTHINYHIHPILIRVHSTADMLYFQNHQYTWVSAKTYQNYPKTGPTNKILEELFN